MLVFHSVGFSPMAGPASRLLKGPFLTSFSHLLCIVYSCHKCRIKFLKVLESIHATGYCRNDIHPHNLLVNGFGEVAIVDFDRAEEDRHRHRHFHEYAQLRDVLDGKEVNRYKSM